jgi:hypothetical protein
MPSLAGKDMDADGDTGLGRLVWVLDPRAPSGRVYGYVARTERLGTELVLVVRTESGASIHCNESDRGTSWDFVGK